MTRAKRLSRAVATMRDREVDGLLVGPGADLRWLLGFDPPPLERLTLLVARADDAHTLIVPELEEQLARDAGLPEAVGVVSHGETDDPYELVRTALDGVETGRLAVGDRLWTQFTLRLQAALPGADWTLASQVLARLRQVKDADEVEALRRAGAAIDRVHARLPEILAPGRTENEVARDVADAIIAEGHDDVRFVIVGSGPNGASPHHQHGDRRLTEGDAVVVDIGGSLDGYCSDCTRNYVIGRSPDGYDDAYAALLEAQRGAVDAVRPGATAGDIDAAARDRLAEAGLAERFIHRTGHGIGLEEHEAPWIMPDSEQRLEPGMAFSVEPGVYLPGRFGARIEDIVVVTDTGCERLNTLDREAVMVT